MNLFLSNQSNVDEYCQEKLANKQKDAICQKGLNISRFLTNGTIIMVKILGPYLTSTF